MKKTSIYFDMDGVLAVWRNVSVEETFTPGFFLSAYVDQKILMVIRMLMDTGYDVRILSIAYNKRCRKEKRAWLNNVGLSKIKSVFVPYGRSKTDYVSEKNAILIDDFTKNLNEWQQCSPSYVGVKYYNGINGTKGTWRGNYITFQMTPGKIYEKIIELAARINLISEVTKRSQYGR